MFSTIPGINQTKKKRYKIMARQKRKSIIAEKARKRLAGVESIDPVLDLGNGNTVVAYTAAITEVDTAVDAYNTGLSVTDGLLNTVKAKEKKLTELSEKMLEAVATKFGHDSNEYEMAGGTRKSEIKRKPKKPTSPNL